MSEIILFNRAFVGNSFDYKELSELGFKVGYLTHPDCSTLAVRDFLLSQEIDVNSTFYKSWQDVVSRDYIEIYLDQIRSYAFGYLLGQNSIPNDGSETPVFTEYKTILPITPQEAIDRSLTMLSSGIALKQETIEQILSVLNECHHSIDITKVKNKEAKMFIHQIQGSLPTEEVEMVRYLVFLATGKSLLIKDKDTIQAIKLKKLDISSLLDRFGLAKLSSVFLRYKLIFLAFKSNPSNAKAINKLRKLATKNHIPMTTGFWESVLSKPESIAELPEYLPHINNFKKVTLIETINVRLVNPTVLVYSVRNGKIWLKPNTKEGVANLPYLKMLKEILYKSLVESLKSKATTIKLPEQTDLKLPKSERSFVGNYPLGTSLELNVSNLIVGINWKSKDGAQDLDLSMVDLKNNKIGWNTDFTNETNSIIYSGDITIAKPEATELIYIESGKSQPSIIKANLYNGEPNSKFKFFIATEKITKMEKNYMVDPNSIKFQTDMVMESKEQSLGVLMSDKFVFAIFRTGNKQVAGDSVTNQYINYSLKTIHCYLSIRDLLTDAGFMFVEGYEEAEIDMTELSKDMLINLLS